MTLSKLDLAVIKYDGIINKQFINKAAENIISNSDY